MAPKRKIEAEQEDIEQKKRQKAGPNTRFPVPTMAM